MRRLVWIKRSQGYAGILKGGDILQARMEKYKLKGIKGKFLTKQNMGMGMRSGCLIGFVSRVGIIMLSYNH